MSGIEAVELSLVFALIVAAESARRLPAGSIVLQRSILGKWDFAAPIPLGRDFYLVAPVPLNIPLVLIPDASERIPSTPLRRLTTQFDARRRRVRWTLPLIQVVGITLSVAFVFGLPYATWKSATDGFLVIVRLIGLLTLFQVVLTMLVLMTVGWQKGAALVASLRLLWPFSAVRAGEIVQDQVATGIPRAVLLSVLVSDQQFVRRFRPFIYDAMVGNRSDPDERDLVSVYGVDRLRQMIETVPRGRESGWVCPRCGAEYSAEVRECSDCFTTVVRITSAC
jgi:hypothetical protein